MIGYRFGVRCLNCGGELEHTAPGRTGTFSARAVATCSVCDIEHLVTVTVAFVNPGMVRATRKRATQQRELQPA